MKAFLSNVILLMAFWTSICSVHAQTDFCSKAKPIQCGQFIGSSNFDTGNILEARNYGSCLSGVNTSANPFNSCEVIYKVDVPANSSLTVTLSGMTKDLDLFIFKGCSVNASCTAKSTNQNNTNELVTINGASGTYYIVIDGYNNEQRSQFQLLAKCGSSCGSCGDGCPEPDNDCQDISYKYVGSAGLLRYNFSVPTSVPLGTWEIIASNGSTTVVENIKSINVNFSTSGQYKICYKYRNSQGCLITCCKTLCIIDPLACSAIAVTQSGSNYVLNLPGVAASNILEWRNDDTGEFLGTGTSITYPVPPSGVCYNISVRYFDYNSGCYRICCKRICGNNCPPVDFNCDKVSFSYTGASGVLKYKFDVPTNLPAGRWVATGGPYGNTEVVLGQGYSVNFTFPSPATYTVCYEYTDQYGCKIKCCRKVCVADPFACDRIVVSQGQGGFNLSVNGVNASNVVVWTNDTNGTTLGTGVTSVFVPLPPAGKCYLISVLIYDPTTGCYQICCKSICVPAHPCGVIEELDVKCLDDVLNVSFMLNNTYNIYTNPVYNVADSEMEIDFIVLAPVGIGFAGCNNVTRVSGIISGMQEIHLKLEGCTLPLTPGEKITIIPILKQRTGEYTAICCHLEPIEIIIPACTACQGPQQQISCTTEYQPVCGCNNVTYSNECFARRDGVNDWKAGVCNGSNLANLGNINNVNRAEDAVAYELSNAPNPFGAATTIRFNLPAKMAATLTIMDLDGRIMMEKRGEFEAGMNEVAFEMTDDLPSGMYWYRLQTEDEIVTKSMILNRE